MHSDKKSILFTISNLGTGGVNSSLSALYDKIYDKYDVYVLTLTHDGNCPFSFKKCLLPKNKFLDAYYCDYNKSKIKDKPFKFIIKFLKRVSLFLV